MNRFKICSLFSQYDCLLCGTNSDDLLCPACINSLPRLSADHCPICALSVTGQQVCGTCLSKPPAYTNTQAAFRYTFPIDAMIQSFKYQKNLAIAPVFSSFLITAIQNTLLPDFIVPMPLHPRRLRERGFNQAVELSRPISKYFNIPLSTDVCTRIKDTPAQATLPWKERKKNIRDVFICHQDLSGQRVAIVDDVMTTGSTLNELAQVLRNQGAVEIYGWIIARSMLEKP